MELSKESSERLKQVAKAAVIPLIGAAALKVVHERNKTRYAYYLEASKGYMVGFVEGGKSKITEFAGTILNSSGEGVTSAASDDIVITVDSAHVTDEEIAELEVLFAESPEEPAATVN